MMGFFKNLKNQIEANKLGFTIEEYNGYLEAEKYEISADEYRRWIKEWKGKLTLAEYVAKNKKVISNNDKEDVAIIVEEKATVGEQNNEKISSKEEKVDKIYGFNLDLQTMNIDDALSICIPDSFVFRKNVVHEFYSHSIKKTINITYDFVTAFNDSFLKLNDHEKATLALDVIKGEPLKNDYYDFTDKDVVDTILKSKFSSTRRRELKVKEVTKNKDLYIEFAPGLSLLQHSQYDAIILNKNNYYMISVHFNYENRNFLPLKSDAEESIVESWLKTIRTLKAGEAEKVTNNYDPSRVVANHEATTLKGSKSPKPKTAQVNSCKNDMPVKKESPAPKVVSTIKVEPSIDKKIKNDLPEVKSSEEKTVVKKSSAKSSGKDYEKLISNMVVSFPCKFEVILNREDIDRVNNRIERMYAGERLVVVPGKPASRYDEDVFIDVYDSDGLLLGWGSFYGVKQLHKIAKILTAQACEVVPLSQRRKGSKYALLKVELNYDLSGNNSSASVSTILNKFTVKYSIDGLSGTEKFPSADAARDFVERLNEDVVFDGYAKILDENGKEIEGGAIWD